MHGVELNSVRGSEFCETLTGGFTRRTPTLRGVELPGSGTPREWNSQGGGPLSKGELSVKGNSQ